MTSQFVYRRRLRIELRNARERRGLSKKDVAGTFGWSPSKLGRIEAGSVSVDPLDLRYLLDLYGVADQTEVDRLIAMARAAPKRSPWAVFRDVLTTGFSTYLSYEGASSRIREYQRSLVPGLLQTEEYAAEIVRVLSPVAPSKLAERAVEAQMQRQELIRGPDRPEMHFILDEAVLRRRVGGGRTMARQVERLVELSQHPGMHLQVMRFERGVYACMQSAFVVLTFPDTEDADLLFLEADSGRYDCRGDPDEVATYARTFVELEDVATPKEHFPEIAAAIAAAA